MRALRLALCLTALAGAPALAELSVSFVDASPDRVTIRNRSACDLGPVELVIDLATSPAGLIFDVSGDGAGFAAHAPLQVVAGGDQVRALTAVTDGDTQLVIALDFLAGDGTVALAVDIDDTGADSPLGRTIVAPAEIAGATAQVRRGPGTPPLSASFGPDGMAVLPLEACIA